MTIRRLTDEVINQIAAGEVIERPASVVKELVENSIDAGSTRIDVEIRGGGVSSIRVLDNGSGMAEDELHLAFMRHTTSKIESAQDLERIMTLGFRGEALASIASVSRVRVESRAAGRDGGYELVIENGRPVKEGPTGCAPGTVITVEDLFANVPARRKFLKTKRTEERHITRMVQGIALAHPEIAFSLKLDTSTVLKTAGGGDLFNVFCAVYGLKLGEKCFFTRAEEGTYHVVGFVAPPTETRADRTQQITIVNGRVVRSPLIYQAIDQGYRPTLAPRRNAVAVLSIFVPPEELDVNVHPAKTEVRFRNKDRVFTLVKRAVAAALSGNAGRTAPFKAKKRDYIPAKSSWTAYIPAARTVQGNVEGKAEDRAEVLRERNLFETATIDQRENWRIIGQVHNTYILLEFGSKLVVIDQHAAHERIIYESLRRKTKAAESQQLLVPLHIDLDRATLLLLEENMEKLRELGFVVEPFGEGAYLLRAVPALLAEKKGTELTGIVEELAATKAGEEDLLEALSVKLSCRAAVKANRKLARGEMDGLVQDLFSTDRPYTCPHGRPTMLEVREATLEKVFHRR